MKPEALGNGSVPPTFSPAQEAELLRADLGLTEARGEPVWEVG